MTGATPGGAEMPPKIEANSPYYLGPQDRPGDFITPVKLKTGNFDAWAYAIRMALVARRKFSIVDGTIAAPAPPCTTDDWLTLQSMLVSWIMNTIDPEVKTLLSNYENAHLLWKDLHERFAVVNGPRIQQLKADVARCEQHKNMSVTTYFGKLKVLWDELNNYEPILSCACGKCTCNLGKAHEKRREDERLHQFLMGLKSEHYSQIRSTLLSQDPLPSLNRAYQQVCQEERVRDMSKVKTEQSETVGFALRTNGSSKPRNERIDRSTLKCTHCQKSGHNINECFELKGYPEWWVGTKKENQKRGSTKQTTSQVGHEGASSQANSREGGSFLRPVSEVRTHNAETSPLPGFTSEQWNTLIAAFENLQQQGSRLTGKFHGNSWIIDTGANRHVTGNFELLTDIQNITPLMVTLPNGSSVIAAKQGTVKLSDNICLFRVLFVPNLKCNLLSVSQISDDLQCFVKFLPRMCAVQDLQTKEVIGTGERSDGLYFLQNTAKINGVTTSTSSIKLWHRRMGHPPEQILKLLPCVKSSDKLETLCEACICAKHSRNPFCLSDNIASSIFELIHCDLWGPYHTQSTCGAKYFFNHCR